MGIIIRNLDELSSSGITPTATDLIFLRQSNQDYAVSLGGILTGAGGGGVGLSAGTQSANNGTVVFSNSNGITFGMSNHSVITASVVNSSLSFSNQNGITFGINGSTLTASVQTNYQSPGAYLTTAMLSNAATISNINLSAGTTSSNLSNFVFSNSNGVSFGLNGSTVTATVATNYQSQGAYLTTAMQSNAATISNVNISAGTTSSNLSNFVFSNSGGVSFGLNGSTVTATVATNYQSQGAYLTTAAQSNQVVNSLNGSTGQISLNIGSSLSSSQNGSSITFGLASNITTALQSAGAYLTTADLSQNSSKYIQNWKLTGNTSGTTSSAQGTDLWLAGGNGVTISGSSNSLSFSVNTSYLASNASTNYVQANAVFNGTNASGTIASNAISISVAAPVGGATNLTMGAGASTLNSVSNILFQNSNGVSFGASTSNNGSITITATVQTNYLTTAALSSQTLALTLGGNVATTNSSQILNGGYILAGGNGVTIQQSNNSVSLSVATNYQSQGAYLTTAALSSQTLAFSLSGNTATTNSSQILNGGYALAGGNGVTLQQSNNTISISVATNYQSQGAYLTTADLSANSSNYVRNWKLTGNTSGTTSSAQGTDLWLAGGNGVTISGSSNTLSFSVATNYQSQGAYLTTAANSTQTLAFVPGTSGNTAGTLATIQSGTIALVGGNNITISQSSGTNSTNLIISGPTLTQYFSNTGTTFNGAGVSGSLTFNTAGLQVSLSAAGGGGIAIADSVSTFSTNTIQFVNTNNVSFSINTGGGSTRMLASVPNISVGIGGGTAQQVVTALSFSNSPNMSWQLSTGAGVSPNIAASIYGTPYINFSASTTSGNFSAVTFANSNNITFGLNNGTITASAAPTTINQTGPNIAAGTQTGTSGTIVFSNSNNFSFGMSNSSIVTLSYNNIDIGMSNVGNTAGTTGTFDGGGLRYVFAATNNVTLSQSSNGASVTLSVAGWPHGSYYMWPVGGDLYQGTSSTTLGNRSMMIQPFVVGNAVSGSYLRHLVSLPAFGSSTQATTANATITNDWYATFYANIFTAGTGANSKSLQVLYNVTAGMTHRWMYTINAGSESVVWQITYPQAGANTNNDGLSYSQTSANINWSTTGNQSRYTGLRWLDLPFASSLSPGPYWIQFQRSTNSATTGGNMANSTGLTTNMTVYNITQASIAVGQFGGVIGSTDGLQLGLGAYSTNSSGGTTNSMSLGGISTIANQPVIPFQIIRQA